jgi:hypothetical protein
MLYQEHSKPLNICIHKVGTKEQGLALSKAPTKIDSDLKSIMVEYFRSPFKSEEYYQLYHDSALALNEVYTYVSAIFDNPEALHEQSVNLAKHLFNQSTHPKVKGGEFYVVYFQDCLVKGETVDAVGLFKSENKDTFLKVYSAGNNFEIESEEGININKLDKGCLIFHTAREDGYLVSVVDNTNKGAEAQYWIDDFLHIRQRQDTYFNTESTLNLYKNYVVEQLPQEYAVTKADQADFLNRTMTFFKEKDQFDLPDFEQEVLQQTEYIESFSKYKKAHEAERDIEIADTFDISDAAVKRQSRSYKSVIKLDKNFDIHIHGDRDLIEQGEDSGGKFYKIYYERES